MEVMLNQIETIQDFWPSPKKLQQFLTSFPRPSQGKEPGLELETRLSSLFSNS